MTCGEKVSVVLLSCLLDRADDSGVPVHLTSVSGKEYTRFGQTFLTLGSDKRLLASVSAVARLLNLIAAPLNSDESKVLVVSLRVLAWLKKLEESCAIPCQ